MGAREVVAPQYNPAPSGGRMSVGQEGGFEIKYDFCNWLDIHELLLRWINNEIRKSQTEHILFNILKFILLYKMLRQKVSSM
jgi:hypothetical protein